MSRLIITEMNITGVQCTVCALEENQKIIELQIEQKGKKTILNNIYVGKVENIASNIQAAFVKFGEEQNGYLPLSEASNMIFSCDRKGNEALRAGDEVLVQVSRDAMKGKLPALSANLNFTGKYLVLTTGEKKFGLSHKLSKEERNRLSKWMEEEIHRPDKEYGMIVRTNASEASKEEILNALNSLSDSEKYGMILRAKGIVECECGSFIHFDYVPGEPDVRTGSASVTGRLCVIGSKINEDALKELFNI